ncbi:hypothetical protein VTI28DRAFT_5694 [Corynascus sepedonium]
MEAIDVSDITLVLPTDGFIVWPDLPSFSGPYSLPPAGKQEKVDIAEDLGDEDSDIREARAMALRTSQAALYYSANVPSDWIDWTAFERPFICRDRACADYGHLSDEKENLTTVPAPDPAPTTAPASPPVVPETPELRAFEHRAADEEMADAPPLRLSSPLTPVAVPSSPPPASRRPVVPRRMPSGVRRRNPPRKSRARRIFA